MIVTFHGMPNITDNYEPSAIEQQLRQMSIQPAAGLESVQKSLVSLLHTYVKTSGTKDSTKILEGLLLYHRTLEAQTAKVPALATQEFVALCQRPTVKFEILFESKIRSLEASSPFLFHDKSVEWDGMLKVASQVLKADYESHDDVKTAFTMSKVPLEEHIDKKDVSHYLAVIHEVLLGNKKLKFHQLPLRTIQENFLLLLSSAQHDDYSTSIISLMYALPYCVNRLKGVASDGLKRSVNGSEEDLTRAIQERIREFIKNPEPLSDEEDWPTINEVMRSVAAGQVAEPFLILKHAILCWIRITKPQGVEIAQVTEACAQFAIEFTQVEDSVQGIAFKLLHSFTEHHGLELAPVLAHFLQADGTSFSWTERLEGEGLDLFVEMANWSKGPRKERLFVYLTRPEASDKCLELAIRLAPTLNEMQARNLINRLSGALLDRFLEAIRAESFCYVTRALLFAHYRTKNLLIAVQLYSTFSLTTLDSLLKLHWKALKPKYDFAITEQDKQILRALARAAWNKNTGEGDSILALFDKATKKCWLEDEIPRSGIEAKLQSLYLSLKK